MIKELDWFSPKTKLIPQSIPGLGIARNCCARTRKQRPWVIRSKSVASNPVICWAGGCKGGTEDPPQDPPDPGCYKCNRCRVSCPVMNETRTFKSTNTEKVYKIRQRLNCDSDWLIYLVTCEICKGQYVGKSKTTFKIRHSNRKQEIKKYKGGLGHHYVSKGV